jgi:hypothetical protein
MTDKPMTGFLWRDGDGVRGELVDALDCITVIVGTPAVRDGVRGYALTATVVISDQLKFPFEEDDAL